MVYRLSNGASESRIGEFGGIELLFLIMFNDLIKICSLLMGPCSNIVDLYTMQGLSLSEAVFTEDEAEDSFQDIDVDCSGLTREEWVNVPVMLVNVDGQNVAKGICRNVDPYDCVEDKCLGLDHVGVLVMEPIEGMMDMGSMFSLRMWPISCVFYERFTLAHHLLVSAHRLRAQINLQERRRNEGRRAYVSSRTTGQQRPTKKSQVLNNASILQLSSFVCCERECTRYFPRDEALALRTEFYTCSPRMRHAKQLEVHGQLHKLPGDSGNVVSLSGREVCEKAWRYIFSVSKTTFYRNRSEFKCGMRARDHGNLNMKRNRVSTQQATATLSTLLEDKADMMPHKSRTLPNGARVVEMVLPRGTKWKKFLVTINEVITRANPLVCYLCAHPLWDGG